MDRTSRAIYMIISQPTNVSDVQSIAYTNKAAPKNQIGVTLWGDQYTLQPTSDSWAQKSTGVIVPKGNYQVSTIPWFPNATGIQAYGDTIGINIEAWSDWKNFKARGNLGTIVLGANFNALNLAKLGKKLKYAFSMAVPTATTFGGGTAQVVAYFNFQNVKKKQGFWLGVPVLDKRFNLYPVSVLWDQGTQMPIILTPMGIKTNLVNFDLPTAGYEQYKFSDLRHYQMMAGADEIVAATKLLSGYSNDPADYVIAHANLNPEIYVPYLISYANIGLRVKNWGLDLV